MAQSCAKSDCCAPSPQVTLVPCTKYLTIIQSDISTVWVFASSWSVAAATPRYLSIRFNSRLGLTDAVSIAPSSLSVLAQNPLNEPGKESSSNVQAESSVVDEASRLHVHSYTSSSLKLCWGPLDGKMLMPSLPFLSTERISKSQMQGAHERLSSRNWGFCSFR